MKSEDRAEVTIQIDGKHVLTIGVRLAGVAPEGGENIRWKRMSAALEGFAAIPGCPREGHNEEECLICTIRRIAQGALEEI